MVLLIVNNQGYKLIVKNNFPIYDKIRVKLSN